MKKCIYFLLLLCMLPNWLQAQSMRVSGTVTDARDNFPLFGVSVMTQDNTGTITDLDGNYFLDVKQGDVLTFSFLGMVSQQVTVGNQSVINVELREDDLTLDEIVVVGYGTMRKSDLTGSLSSLKSEQLTQLSAVDVTQSIQGRAPGVSVISNSGEPGAGTKIRIRGTGSVNNSDPLYVVDGFPVDDISHIAPHDIEALEILKDASAVAIYGSRGANGVILVKTKTGSFDQKTQVNVNIFAGLSKVAKKIDVLNAAEFATLKLESYRNAGMTPDLSTQSMLQYAIDNNLRGTNWQDEILRDGSIQNYNVNVSGGSTRSKFDLGMTYSSEKGTVKNTYMDKFMFHLNNEYKLFNNVNAGINLSYVTYKKNGNDEDYYQGAITQAVKTDPITTAWDTYTDNWGEVYFSYQRNPAQAAYENKYRKKDQDRFLGMAYLQINDIGVKGLSFRAQFGKQFSFDNEHTFLPQFYVAPAQQRAQSSLEERRERNTFWNTNEYFSYVNQFGQHSINATLGVEAQYFKSNYILAKAYDVPEDANLQYLSASPNKQLLAVEGFPEENSLLSAFFRFNYNYANRYLFTGTFRADGTSKFKKRWGYFPSFSLGWNLNQENFMESLRDNISLSQFKLRAGWGSVGNQASAGNFDYLALMTNGYTAVIGDQIVDGAVLQTLANEEISWETSEQYNIGVDVGFFNNALSFNIDYFIRNTNDMILDTPVPMYAGMWKTKTNAGSVRNSGLEFNINYDGNITKDFSYNVGFNMAFIDNEVTSLGGGEPIYGWNSLTRTEEGREIAYFYGLETAGIFKTQEQLDAHVKDGNPIQPNASLGDVIFVDRNNDGVIDEKDRTYLGSATPDFTYGLSLSMGYKGFDLNLFFQGVQGSKIVNYMYSSLYSTNMTEWSNSKEMMNRWTPDNPTSDLPRIHAGDPNQNDRFSDRFVENGSYFRLRTLQLGYTLPKSLTQKVFLNQARFYISADNVFTVTKYSGFNPEIGDHFNNPLNAGVDVAAYPVPRTFTIGCNLKF